MGESIVALFERRDEAERAMRDLLERGIPQERVSMVAGDQRAEAVSHRRPGGAATAEAIAVGGFMGLAGLAAIAVPGIGMALLAAPVAAALGDIRLHAADERATYDANQDLRRLLSGIGLEDEQIPAYVRDILQGQSIVVVDADDRRVDLVDAVLHRYDIAAIEFRRHAA
jgi:hypothetical protein